MSLRVLAVDDSRTMRAMLETVLSDAGFEVVMAVDGEDGLMRLRETVPDVVITDINMPRLDGFGFIAAVRAGRRWHGLPILVLTTESSAAHKTRARASGATGWIVKPFDEDKLIAAVHRVAARAG